MLATVLWSLSAGCSLVPHGYHVCFPMWGIGCKYSDSFVEPKKYSVYVSPHLHRLLPRRVLIVPTGTEAGRYQAPQQFAEVLSGAIRSAGLCEVVLPPAFDCGITVDRLLNGQFDEWEITVLSQAWHCDAIVFVRVNQLKAHVPLRASVTLALVDASEAVVLFAVDGNWDTTDPDIGRGFDRFVKTRTQGLAPSQTSLHARSPAELFAYVAHQIANAWLDAVGKSVPPN